MPRNGQAVVGWGLALLALLAGNGVAAPRTVEEDLPENRLCFKCHNKGDFTMEFADDIEVPIRIDKRLFLESAHGRMECTACHVGLDALEHMDEERPTHGEYRRLQMKRCAECHEPHGEGESLSEWTITSTLHPLGSPDAPLCGDCHPAHSMTQGEVMQRTTSHTCAECHEAEYSDFAASAHGASLLGHDGTDLPICTDCHPGHEATGSAAIARSVRRGQPCMQCHGDAELMEPYGLSTNVVQTYLSDFHGVSLTFYEREQADIKRQVLVCADCHGVHDVARFSEGTTATMKEKLVSACRSCHPDAAEAFPDAWLSHYEPSLTEAPLVYLIRLGYWIFIPFVVIGLTIQILLHLVLEPLRKRREKVTVKDPPPAGPATFTRFHRRARLEHFLVMISFTALLITGLPQKFHDSNWAIQTIEVLGGIDLVRAIHRVTGLVFGTVLIAHLVSAAWKVLRHRAPVTMSPTKKDFRDAIVSLRYYLGKAKRLPEFDRFDYRQKFEYWGMLVGGMIMILSGLVLYFPMFVADFLPGQVIPAAKVAHSYEAMMALLIIIIWHMYSVHFNRETFPMDTSIFTGKISRERMQREHPQELQRLEGPQAKEDSDSEAPAERPTPPVDRAKVR